MPKSSAAEMAALRSEVIERAQGICEWIGCVDPGTELAHLTHRGMGGSKIASTAASTIWMCARHHDCLDGRTGLGTLRWELGEMLRYVVNEQT